MRRLLCAALTLPLLACDDAEPTPAPVPLQFIEMPASAAAAGAVTAELIGPPGATVTVAVTRGGGAVDQAQVVLAASGHGFLQWTLGPAPVDQALTATVADDPQNTAEHRLRATLDTPWAPEAFGQVNEWLMANGLDESTEDLSFRGDELLMGVPGGVVRVTPSGEVEALSLSGEAVTRIWGFAVAADGTLWAVDAGNSRMVAISPDGAVREALTTDGDQPLVGPNYVMVGADGRIYLSDPCLGEIIRLDPATGETAVHRFDLPTEGGPNGMALGPDGAMYVATENTGLLCNQPDITIDAEIAGVYRLDLTDFTTRTPVVEGVALFGDGLAFDAEGNLYVVLDTQENFQLKESAVKVIPAGTTELLPFVVAGEKQLIANVAFGTDTYGATTLYMGMLHIPPFTTKASRGLTRVPVGIAGQPLLP
ncbi:MAG: hypothetical protein KC613_16155 [Myxococcales bacterium]|nr:hypothetical protein [Myxococcales bacterium]MCB9526619.1 hypothetical protein [Myxococcales bacterium]